MHPTVGSGLFGSFTADDLVIAEARNYIGRYGTPADGQRLRDLEGEYRGRRTPEAKIRRLDAVMQVLTDMNKRGTP